jgi:nitroreductase
MDQLNEELRDAPILTTVIVVLVTVIVVLALRSGGGVDVYHLLTRTRRSVGSPDLYTGNPAPMATIRKALECAIRAPNHFLSEPWRFRMLNAAQQEQIVELCAFDGKKPLFRKVPQMMVVSIEPSLGDDKWNVKALEDHAACACAVQNFMVYLASEGVATKWMTGAMGISGAVILSDVCGIDTSASEHFMGVIMIGEPAQALDSLKVPTRKTGLSAPVLVEY